MIRRTIKSTVCFLALLAGPQLLAGVNVLVSTSTANFASGTNAVALGQSQGGGGDYLAPSLRFSSDMPMAFDMLTYGATVNVGSITTGIPSGSSGFGDLSSHYLDAVAIPANITFPTCDSMSWEINADIEIKSDIGYDSTTGNDPGLDTIGYCFDSTNTCTPNSNLYYGTQDNGGSSASDVYLRMGNAAVTDSFTTLTASEPTGRIKTCHFHWDNAGTCTIVSCDSAG